RLPTLYASQGYDTAQSMDAAIRDVKGRIEDKAAMRKALEAANFKSVRGPFKFNRNHNPIHNIYLRMVTRDSQSRVTNRTVGVIINDAADPYAAKCSMPKT